MDYKNNDVNILHIPPQYPGDTRVFKAVDFYAQSILQQRYLKTLPHIQDQILEFPELSFTESQSGFEMSINISGLTANLVNIPSKELSINENLRLFDKLQTPQTSSKFQYLQVFSFLSEIGEIQDNTLGNTSLDYYVPNFNSLSPDFQEIEIQTKENSRRLRAFWGIILSEEELFNQNHLNNLIESGDTLPSITIPVNSDYIDYTLDTGNKVRIYILDNNFNQGTQYYIFNEFFNSIPFLELKRNFGFTSNGYTWGDQNSERLLNKKFNCKWVKDYYSESLFPENHLSLLLSSELPENDWIEVSLNKAVYNLFEGSHSQGEQPGVNLSSPNGFNLLTAPDRVQFKNEKHYQAKTFKKRTVTKNNNNNLYVTYNLDLGDIDLKNGQPIAYINQNTNSHTIYNNFGVNITDEGSFSVQNNVLSWFPNINSSLEESDEVYIQPSIIFKSGSGFNMDSISLDKCWHSSNGSPEELSDNNIRDASTEDINFFETPADNQKFIVVFGKARNAIHYIYRYEEVESDNNGILRADNLSDNGVFAFISGIEGRINKPIINTNSNLTTFSCLVYHIPSSSEKWQFEFTITEPNFVNMNELNNSKITSDFVQIAHTQGGGASVYETGGEMRFSNFDKKLKPLSNPQYPSYSLNTPIMFGGEEGYESVGWRFVTFPPGSGLSYPKKGRNVTVNNGAIYQSNKPLGYKMPKLKTNKPYQSLFGFICQTNAGKDLLVIVKSNLIEGNVKFEDNDDTSISVINLN